MLRLPRHPTPLPIPVTTIARPRQLPNFARRPQGTVPPEDEWHCLTPVPVPPRPLSQTLIVPVLRPRRSLALAMLAVVAAAVAFAVTIAAL